MKKHYLSLLLLLVFAPHAYSQFFEGFEGTSSPDPVTGQWPLDSGNWQVSDNGIGLTQSWIPVEPVPSPPPSLVHQGLRAAYMNRENIGAGNTLEDWLVTPAVAVETGDLLKFFSRTSLNGNQGTFYQVRISTTSQTDHAAFSTVGTWTESELTETYNLYEQKIIPLDSFIGQNVYIAFVMVYTQPTTALSGDRWLLDDVSVSPIIQQYNTISGFVTFGNTLAECGGDNPANNIALTTNGIDYIYSGSNALGEGYFEIHATDLNTTVTGLTENQYFSFTPPSYTFNFTDFGNDPDDTNFCMTPNGVHPDLEIVFFSNSVAVPNSEMYYTVIYKNKGTQPQSGTVNFSFDDAVLDYQVPGVELQPFITASPNNLSFGFNDLQPFETRMKSFLLTSNSPTDTPPVNLGDVLVFNATIASTLIDETPADNSFNLNQTVAASFDPNDKTVLEGATITPEQVLDYLHYVVRFQNTGTAPAQKVVLRDVLADELDPATFQMIGESHSCSTTRSGNLLEFTFNDINLPPVSIDEPGSNGFVVFKIKPRNTVGLGSVINNTANIYFDFNFPITTNTATTTVTALGTTNPNLANLFSMYPNPAKNELHVATDTNLSIAKISIYNMLGQLVKVVSANESDVTVDISSLGRGSYVVEILSDKGKLVKKLIKM